MKGNIFITSLYGIFINVILQDNLKPGGQKIRKNFKNLLNAEN